MTNLHLRRLRDLSSWLKENRELWTERPFIGLPVHWESRYPNMANALRALPYDVAERYEANPWELDGIPEPFSELVRAARKLGGWPELGPGDSQKLRPPRVRGRKWEQVKAFVEVVQEQSKNSAYSRWVDWCSGKGHLGRALAAATEKPLVCVERDAALCKEGAVEAEAAGIETEFYCDDVLSSNLDKAVDSHSAVAALHACGELNKKVLELVVRRKAVFAAIAPCCYQRTSEVRFIPLSEAGKKHPVELDRHQLRFVSFSENVTSQASRDLRRREQVFRLGFDLLHRQVSGRDEYTPTGSVKGAWVRGSFEGFCINLACSIGFELPGNLDYSSLEKAGKQRLGIVHSLGIVRGIFRRPLESWLLLDRALYLEEAGFRTTLGAFCAPEITPRNLIIVAVR